MTFEDFAESVVAGWIPAAWHPAMHVAVIAWKWIAAHVIGGLALIIARARK